LFHVTRHVRLHFRDHNLAAERLTLVGETFASVTARFLEQAAPRRPQLALDLGCGLGHTTRLIADVVQPHRVIAIDRSESFLALAKENTEANVTFKLHDVTKLPLPGSPADLIFCRFLLTHLNEPQDLIHRWTLQLTTGGRLLVQEPDEIRSTNSTINRYLEILEALLDSRGTHLYVGRILAKMTDPQQIRRVIDRTTALPVPASRAAEMFRMNLKSWRDDGFVRAAYSSGELDELQVDLTALTQQRSGTVEWSLRELGFTPSSS
jgi:trans-aconitate 2-methyltransferase